MFKPLVDRIRTHEVGTHHRIVQVGSQMFPSVHVTAAAALATFVLVSRSIVASRSRSLLVLPFVVSCATISLQLHYPADVIGGFLLGTTFVWCTITALDAITRPEPAGRERGYDPVRTGG